MSEDLEGLALEFAPVFAQKVTREWAAADHITGVDLAGGVGDLRRNPGHLMESTAEDGSWSGERPGAQVYFSVCETATHVFLLYAAYHAMDWWKRFAPDNLYDLIRDGVDEHAHDMEGALLVVRKAPEPTLDALVTLAHDHFYLYTEPLVPTSGEEAEPWPEPGRSLRIRDFRETVDGHIWVDRASQRPKLYVESRRHGVRGDHRGWGGGDLVRYYYPEHDDAPPEPVEPRDESETEPYALVDVFADGGLWEHRFDPRVFRQRRDGRWGFVAYRDLTEGRLVASRANPPWSWNDRDDPSPVGEMATDPAHFLARYAEGTGPLARTYRVNPYLGT